MITKIKLAFKLFGLTFRFDLTSDDLIVHGGNVIICKAVKPDVTDE